MSLDFSDYDPNKTGGLPLAGKAHFLVSEVEDKGNYYNVTLEILAHEKDSEVGKTSYNNFQKAGKGARRLQYFLEATKVITRELINEAAARGETSVDFDIEDAEGVTFFGDLKKGSYTNSDGEEKDTCKVEWTFIAADDPAAAEYPRNAEFVPNVPGGDAQPKQQQEAAPAPAKEEATVPAGDDDCPF